jgi:hypothetical protein
MRTDVFGQIATTPRAQARVHAHRICGEIRHAEVLVATHAVSDGVIQAADEEQRALLQGQREGPFAVQVRQTAVM